MEENTRPNSKQTKRQWTSHEDAKLVECLVELATTSWKCDNGTFKSGYGKHLEKMLHEKIPGCDLKREATLSDRQVNENTQVNLEETEMEYEADSQEPPTPGVPVAPGASAAPSSSAAPSASYIERNKRKRGSKSEEVIDIVVESMRDMKGAYQEHTAVLVDMVSCFKHEKEGAERRMKLMALLRDVPGLSGDDRMKAGLSILKDNSLIDMVFQLQPGKLLPFLKKLL
ncbi:hypothetical protein Ahy_A06g028308 [Arachis hypogaea]|uniref:Myb/SANT-like domain-containing protein n=1 Tax=Arachis hypogaea TaxID=3818 RepID=A0A445CQQ9_ARAHY|nr:hypothetical protein Ahy_A06g028308 [Arachis hypogaea]